MGEYYCDCVGYHLGICLGLEGCGYGYDFARTGGKT